MLTVWDYDSHTERILFFNKTHLPTWKKHTDPYFDLELWVWLDSTTEDYIRGFAFYPTQNIRRFY